jgi:light-independent protochlorophyllide reductase subunit B
MKLAYWMYAGPAHIGTLRVASSFKNVHAIMHAPLGDDYFNVMRSMLERERDFTPVTASIVDRHVLARGSQEKVVENITRKNKEESPDLILLTPTCTSSILQEDLHNFVERSTLALTGVSNNLDLTQPTSVTLKENSITTTAMLPQQTTLDANTYSENSKNQVRSAIAPEGGREELFSVMPERITEELFLDPNMVGVKVNSLKGKSVASKNFVVSQTRAIQDLRLPPSGADLHNSDRPHDITLYAEGIEVRNGQSPLHGQDRTAGAASNNNQVPDVILADVNHYRVNELQAADRTLEQIVRYYIEKAKKQNNLNINKTEKPSVNIIGIFTLGFHNQHDCRELKRLLNDLGITINEIIPEGGNVYNLKNLPKAWFNFVPYREVGLMTAVYLKSEFNMPYVSITPMGLVDTALCIREIGKIISNQLLIQQVQHSPSDRAHHDAAGGSRQRTDLSVLSTDSSKVVENIFNNYIDQQTRFISQAAWFSRSIDCQNLTGKKAVVFGDATHAAAMTKILAREMGIRVSCAGTYCKHDADWFREQVTGFCDQILITDDHTQVGDTIAKLEPAAIFGTQMERHVGKRLDIPCGVISAPVHIQNFPLGFRPFLGYEGTNQIADLVYNSFNLGMEDHLLQIFGGHDSVVKDTDTTKTSTKTEINLWSPEGLAELNKVPGFVRGKVKRNTEKYALQNNISLITVEIMYAAKEALSN